MAKKSKKLSTYDTQPNDESAQNDITGSPSRCELCERTDIALTRHHLIPQSRHNKARTKRVFSRIEMKTEIALLCCPCHSQVHEIFTNQELSGYYHTVARLKEHTEMQKFINWVRKRPAGQRIRVKSSSLD